MEKTALANLASDMENMFMFGSKNIDHAGIMQQALIGLLDRLTTKNVFSAERIVQIRKLIDTKDVESMKLAENILLDVVISSPKLS